MFTALMLREAEELKMQTQTFPEGEVKSTYKIVSTMWSPHQGTISCKSKVTDASGMMTTEMSNIRVDEQ